MELPARPPVNPRVTAALAGWSVALSAVMVWRGGRSWHYFTQGQQALADLDDRSVGGLHVYAGLPFLQIGPVAFLATGLTAPAGPHGGLVLAQAFGVLAGLVILLVVRDLARIVRDLARIAGPELTELDLDRRLLLAGLFFLPVWVFLAVGQTHLDDVLALLFGVLALRAAVADRALATGVLVGLAVDSKPWALPFLALVLLLSTRSMTAVAIAVGVVAVAWLPFFLADPGTVHALRYAIPNTPMSALRVLGVDSPTTPPWCRSVQAVLGVGLAVQAVRRGRWPLTLLVVIAARVVLDPGTNRYYAAGVVLGAAIWDVVGSPAALPWWTGAACLCLFTSRSLPLPPCTYGTATLAFFAAVCMLLLTGRPTVPVAAGP
jgi:hypothetical protein